MRTLSLIRLAGLALVASSLGACFGLGGDPAPTLSISSPADVTIGSFGAKPMWTVTNTGSGPVTLGAATAQFTGPYNGPVAPTLSGGCREDRVLAAGEACNFFVDVVVTGQRTQGTVTVTIDTKPASGAVSDTVTLLVP